jgi:hypothetical protein
MEESDDGITIRSIGEGGDTTEGDVVDGILVKLLKLYPEGEGDMDEDNKFSTATLDDGILSEFDLNGVKGGFKDDDDDDDDEEEDD